jgi:hypothetical protein
LVSAGDYAYHKHEAPIIYEHTKLIKTLTARVNQLYEQFNCCRSIPDNIVSLYNHEFNGLIVWEILNTSAYPGAAELAALFDKESQQIVQEGVLAAWLTIDDTRFRRSILRQAGELSYGMVLKHPIAIKRAASYLCNYSKDDELQGNIPSKIVAATSEQAIDRVMIRRPNESRTSIIAALKNARVL